MYKVSIIFATLLVAVANSAHLQAEGGKKVEADKEFLTKQKGVLQLYTHIHQTSLVSELNELVKNYDLEQSANDFNDPESLKHFLKLYKSGEILDHRKIFSPLYKAHAWQAKAVFEVLYNAKDWNSFMRAAAWMRDHINDRLFLYVFSIAVLHRPDTQGIVLPPLYEACPHLFVSAETIQKAYDMRMKHSSKHDGKESVILPTNYTGWLNTNNPELRTSYLTEDVGFNFYHLLHHLTYPHWLKPEHQGIKNERQGEHFYYVHNQILARYKLERHANNMYQMRNFTYDEPNIVAYYPNLIYKNGKSVPGRPEHLKLRDYDLGEIERVKNLERRIRDAIDSGWVKTSKGEKVPLTSEKGIDVLGRIVDQTTTSVNPKYYGTLFQHLLNLLGHIVDPFHQNDVAPSTLQHFQTMLRDPMYYRLYQRVNSLFEAHKKTLPAYAKEHLEFPGVTVETVEVDKMMTFFENFDIDITNAVTIGKAEDDKSMKIVARVPRLNHKEFTYRITVNSNQDVTGLIHVFLAPKYDQSGMQEMSLAERREYMIQIDRFSHQLKSGKTVIERNSKDSSVTVGDMTSFRVLSKRVEDAIQGKSQFYLNDKGQEYGFPRRLILPRGTKAGTSYKLYVVITPYQTTGSRQPVRGIKTFVTCGGQVVCGDSHPLGFPFDRDVVEREFDVPNIRETDVTIYHKKIQDYNMEVEL